MRCEEGKAIPVPVCWRDVKALPFPPRYEESTACGLVACKRASRGETRLYGKCRLGLNQSLVQKAQFRERIHDVSERLHWRKLGHRRDQAGGSLACTHARA